MTVIMADRMVDETTSGPPALPEDVTGELSLPVFAFGDLLDPSFVEQLLEHPVHVEPAKLKGYRLDYLPGIGWPILVPDDHGTVAGRIYRHLGAEDIERIAANQGVGEGLYRKTVGSVEVSDCEHSRAEAAFIFLPTDRTLRRHINTDSN